VDLPGTYYLQVVEWLFKDNRIAAGQFPALGHLIDVADIHVPIYLVAARDDELVAAEQLFATAPLVSTPGTDIKTAIEPCGHLGLFLGAETMHRLWPDIARWLNPRN
jgi:poly(3-hydroxyalkanoate) synthetase